MMWRRGRRRRHTPTMSMSMMMMVVIVMVMVVDPGGLVSARLRHCRPGECDCGKRRDYLHLVHCRVPFSVSGYVFPSDRSADKPSDKSADKRRPDFAPVLSVESAVVVMLRLMMLCRRRRSRSVAHYPMPWSVLCVSGVVLCRLLCGSRRLFRMNFLCRSPHRRRSLASGRRVSFRCRHRGSAKCAANRQRNHHLLHCLVHCRVPFVFAQAHSHAYTELGKFTETF